MHDWTTALRARLAALRLPQEREAELVDELAQHLDELCRDRLADGLSSDEALRLTLAELERASLLRGRLAPSDGLSRSPASARLRRRVSLLDDGRHAWRRLTARPGASLLCAALLALGIGLATAMFSVVDSLMLRRAPFPDAHRIVTMGLRDPEPDLMQAWMATGMFEAVEALREARFQTNDSAAEAWPGAFVTPGVLEMLGARAIRGRVFTAADTQPGSGDAVLLSETIWRSAFGADPDILGRQVTLDDRPLIVTGIMPAAFRFPTPATVVWRPLDPVLDRAEPGGTTIVGRLKPGVPRDNAERRTGAIAHELSRIPQNYLGSPPLRTVGRPDELDDFTRQALWLLLGGVVLVFVVLCANAGSLLLAQLSARRREFGLCTALGAPRARLMRQTAFEHALISMAGAAAGVGLAWALIAIVPTLFLGRTLNPIDVDPRALGAAMVLGMTAVLLSGLLPAWVGTRIDAADAVRGSRQGGTDTRTARLAARGLLVAEVALACSLLVGSALLARSFANLVNADRGLDMDGLVHVDVDGIEDAFFTSREANALGTAAIQAQVLAWPEVDAVALSREIPPTWQTGTVYLGAPPPSPPRPSPTATQAELEAWMDGLRSVGTRSDMYRVDPSFFGVYGIDLVRGRPLAHTDSDRDAVVGERLANQLWPGVNPIGQSFTVGRTPGYRVVGVAGEIRLPTLDRELDRPEFYIHLGSDSRSLYLGLRCRAACPDVATMQSRLRRVHPALTADVVPAAENAYLAQLRLPRAIAEVGSVFAVVAVLTAAGGLFSVMTYTVGRRRREFGIRAALGASPGRMGRLVFRDGLTLVAVGAVAGAMGGWLVARALAAFQYGVTAADPVAWAAVTATIGLTSVAASWRPARQAMRIDPVKLLREE